MPKTKTTLVLHKCDDPQEAIRVLENWIVRTDFPQHKNLGKKRGGIAIRGKKAFWIWKTKSAWHAEQEKDV